MTDVLVRYGRIREVREIVFETRFRGPSEVEHNFDHVFDVSESDERLPDGEGKDVEEL
ncbi:MAG TPA: hypothetical protein VGF86_02445 [Candidatus Tumulicola sp.]